MTKNIWIGVVVLVIVLGCGIVEVAIMSAKYKELYDECKTVLDKCDEQSLSVEEYEQFRKKWVKLRETSEILLPPNDVYELNLRFAEAQAYVEQGDFKQVEAQLTVALELLSYVPHLMKPTFWHIM